MKAHLITSGEPIDTKAWKNAPAGLVARCGEEVKEPELVDSFMVAAGRKLPEFDPMKTCASCVSLVMQTDPPSRQDEQGDTHPWYVYAIADGRKLRAAEEKRGNRVDQAIDQAEQAVDRAERKG